MTSCRNRSNRMHCLIGAGTQAKLLLDRACSLNWVFPPTRVQAMLKRASMVAEFSHALPPSQPLTVGARTRLAHAFHRVGQCRRLARRPGCGSPTTYSTDSLIRWRRRIRIEVLRTQDRVDHRTDVVIASQLLGQRFEQGSGRVGILADEMPVQLMDNETSSSFARAPAE